MTDTKKPKVRSYPSATDSNLSFTTKKSIPLFLDLSTYLYLLLSVSNKEPLSEAMWRKSKN
jgi:hypothetical protein